MGVPSSQISAVWVQEELVDTTWVLLRQVLFTALRKRMVSYSEDDISDFVEENLTYVAEHLRDCVADWLVDGSVHRFEIDSDPSPYIRLIATVPSEVVSKLRRIDPYAFELVCARVLAALGAKSKTTQRTNDGGVDFLGANLNVVPTPLAIPASARISVIGQAKRYRDGHAVSETQLREFIGAATFWRHKLLREGTVGPLSPVLFAFWTTSDFEQNARLFARESGLWYMDGVTLAGYIVTLGLKDSVLGMADAQKPCI
jgi:hypothetical protein